MIRPLFLPLLLATSLSAHATCERTFVNSRHHSVGGTIEGLATVPLNGDALPDLDSRG